MSSGAEEEYNDKLKKILNRLLMHSNTNILEDKYLDVQTNCQFYIHFSQPINSIKFSLSNLRLLLFCNFLANLTKKSIHVNVGINENESHAFQTKLNKIIELFNLNKNLRLEFIEKTETMCTLKEKLAKLDAKYKIDVEMDERNLIEINFPIISSELNLMAYDKSLKLFNVIEMSDSYSSFEAFINQNSNNRNLLYIICSNSEYLQKQKVDLLTRALLNNQSKVKYICMGAVRVQTDSPIEDEIQANDAVFNYQSREKFFRYAASQRQKITNDSIYEENIKNLTLFSIVFDLLNTKHQIDVKNFKMLDSSKFYLDDDEEQMNKLSEQASFILYNCARLNAIIEKYDNNLKNGVFKQEDMPSINEMNYYSLLNNDFEKNLCQNFLFKYESIFDEIYNELKDDTSPTSLQTKLNTTKLFKFVVDLSNLVSKYYSKIHILEDPKLTHLHAKMTARIYLIKSIYNLIKYIINLFGIDALKRI